MDRRGFFKALGGLAAVPVGLMVGVDKSRLVAGSVSIRGAEFLVGDNAGTFRPLEEIKGFDLGDVVRLNSGGPDMKIVGVTTSLQTADQRVRVKWEGGEGSCNFTELSAACVTKVEPDGGTILKYEQNNTIDGRMASA